MVFNKQLGKLINRNKSVITPKKIDAKNEVAENPIQSDMNIKLLILEFLELRCRFNLMILLLLIVIPLTHLTRTSIWSGTLLGVTSRIRLKNPHLAKLTQTIFERLKGILNEVLQIRPAELHSKNTAGQYLVNKCIEVLDNYRFNLDFDTRSKLLYYVVRDNLGFGKIDPIMRDPLIEDVSCNGVNVPLYIWHRKFESIPTNIRFETAEELDTI